MLPGLLLVFFVMYLISYMARTFKQRIQLSSIDGPQGVPLLGNALEIIKAGNDHFLELLKGYNDRFGQRYKIYLGLQPYIVLWNSKDVEKVLSSQTHIDKSKDYDYLLPWLGTGLLTSSGSKWTSRRKMLTPAFHFKILEDFLIVMNEQSKILVDILSSKVKETRGFNLFPIITHAALDIICETAMGRKINAQLQSDSDYVTAIYRISELVQRRQMNPLLQPDILWSLSPSGREEKRLLKILHGFTDEVIKAKKAERKRSKKQGRKSLTEDDLALGKKRRQAFLDLLLDAQEKEPGNLLDRDIREETDTFLFEGHDTTAASMNWTLFLLGHNPEAQQKVHEELDSIFGSSADKTSEITLEQLTKMKYLELCIKESLRLYPSVPFIGRRLDSHLELDAHTKIPPSTMVVILNHFMHRDEKVFPDCEKFDPDRFLQENSLNRSPFAYVPFSAGPRNCIGQKFALMEEKIVLSQVLRNFKITSLERREDLTLRAELITRPKDGLKVRLEKRL